MTASRARGSIVAALGVAAGLAALIARRRRASVPEQRAPTHVKAAITVWKPREEVYAFWHDFAHLPTFMAHLESVEPRGVQRSHWRAKAPGGRTVEWDAEVVEDRPNELIAWRAVDGGQIDHAGSVRFRPAPGNWGTEIVLDMDYTAPGGALGEGIARLFGEQPRQQVEDDLRRFKQVMEAGEVVRSDGSPEGTFARRALFQRPAQPEPATASTNGGAS